MDIGPLISDSWFFKARLEMKTTHNKCKADTAVKIKSLKYALFCIFRFNSSAVNDETSLAKAIFKDSRFFLSVYF